MRRLLLVVLGVLFIVGPIVLHAWHRSTYERDVRGVQQLQRQLDSARAALSRAATPADSQRLAQDVQSREYFLGRRAYHVGHQGAALDAWWRPTGRGTILLLIGAALVLSGGVLTLKRASGRVPEG